MPTEKIIDRLPPALPRVAFKLESGRSEAELLEIGRPLLARDNTWAVVAGNLEGVGPGEAQESWVLTPAATHVCRTKGEIAERILEGLAGRFSS